MAPIASALSRREFLVRTSTAAAAAAMVYPVGIRAAEPVETVNLAAVGVGGKGWSDINNTAAEANVVAFCDIDHNSRRFAEAAKQWPKARRYADFREMLDREHRNLHGVTVSTPDHMHAPVTMTAMHHGLATYTQKPLTRTVYEARQLALAAQKAGTVTQMGNQGHSRIAYRTVVELVRSGAVGKIKEAHTWSNRPVWPQGIDRPSGSDPVPSGLHWDLWLGVAKERPYLKDTYHPFKWRGWYEFGAGALGDMGCHIIDPVVWALELGAPTEVRYEGPTPKPETFPEWEILHYTFPGTQYTAGRSFRMWWYDGGRQPDRSLFDLPKGEELPKSGGLLIGEKGAIFTPHVATPRLLPEEKFADYKLPELEDVDHYLQWTRAIRGEGETTSHFGYAGPLTETVLLGVVASRCAGETLAWDSENLRVTNVAKANDYLREDYRKGWEVEGL